MESKENNFKQMLFEELKEMPEAPLKVENSLDGSVGFINHLSKVVELYLPKLVEAFKAFLGAEQKR